MFMDGAGNDAPERAETRCRRVRAGVRPHSPPRHRKQQPQCPNASQAHRTGFRNLCADQHIALPHCNGEATVGLIASGCRCVTLC